MSGGKGSFITPFVKTKGDYVMLEVKSTAPADPNAQVGGMPLVIGTLYDAETGEEWIRNQSVYKAGGVAQDGHTFDKPGVYFALIICAKDGVAWEATIKE